MTRRRLRWILIGDIVGLLAVALGAGEHWLEGKSFLAWDMLLFLALAAVFILYWPVHKWLRYRQERATPAHGWEPGDRVITTGHLGKLVDHPPLYHNQRELTIDLDRWSVRLDDGELLESVHHEDLRRLSAIDRLGDLVRLVRA